MTTTVTYSPGDRLYTGPRIVRVRTVPRSDPAYPVQVELDLEDGRTRRFGALSARIGSDLKMHVEVPDGGYFVPLAR